APHPHHNPLCSQDGYRRSRGVSWEGRCLGSPRIRQEPRVKLLLPTVMPRDTGKDANVRGRVIAYDAPPAWYKKLNSRCEPRCRTRTMVKRLVGLQSPAGATSGGAAVGAWCVSST